MKTMTPVFLAAIVALATGCKRDSERSNDGTGGGDVGGSVIAIDGSSTVFPITQAVAEEFQAKKGGQVTVGVSGTGGGFKKFCRGDVAVTGASRPIKKSELEQCKASGIEIIELPVAYDGIAVVVNSANTWVDHLTTEELKKIWSPGAEKTVTRWSDVRDGFPDAKLVLFAPGVDSGTFDYFTKAINGKEQASRTDFTSSEDDNILVTGVAGDKGAISYFGYAYYAESKDKVKLVAINDGDPANGEGPIEPSPETVANGTYQPLSRPIFIYVSKKAAGRPEVSAFVQFYLTEGSALTTEVGYIPLSERAYEMVRGRFESGTPGTMFTGGSKVGATVEKLLEGA
jgi:phosphate transport system substrate-binding protein